MSTETNWVEEARKQADAKHNARQARFMAPDDDAPKGDDILLLPVDTKLEGIVNDLSDMTTEFGVSKIATITTDEYGVVKVLAGAQILEDLFSVVGVGDFVSILWKGKKANKDGTRKYRSFSVAHIPAPGSGRETYQRGPERTQDTPLPGMESTAMSDEDEAF